MRRSVRAALFWSHLVAGLLVGVVLAVMASSGAAMAFMPQIVRWAERPSATVSASDGAPRVSIDRLVASVREQRRGRPITAIVVSVDADAAVYMAFSKAEGCYVDPWSGAVREPSRAYVRRTFATVEALHRSLTMGHVGEAITGATALAMVVLSATGLYLWWPRKWRWKSVRPVLWFRGGLQGKARDFNWHNAVGLWCSPVLLTLALSGSVIAYHWASDLVYRAAGEAPPGRAAALRVGPSVGSERALPLQSLLTRVSAEAPRWQSITVRGPVDESRPPTAAMSFVVRERDAPTRFAARVVQVDPYTLAVLKTESYESASAGRKARLWIRFLHTGEALGFAGQAAVMLAALGALVLAYTGAALSFRRFFRKGKSTSSSPASSPASAR